MAEERRQRTRLTLEDFERQAGPPIPELTPQQRLGVSLFKGVLAALGVGLVVLGAYAILTWPTTEDIAAHLAASDPGERSAAIIELRSDWHDQVRQTAQLVLVGPFITLLSAIVGYVLGRDQALS